ASEVRTPSLPPWWPPPKWLLLPVLFFGKFACKVCHPGIRASPMPALLAAARPRSALGKTVCASREEFRDLLPVVFWACPEKITRRFLATSSLAFGCIMAGAQAWVTGSRLVPELRQKDASTHKLFCKSYVLPPVLIDQSMALKQKKKDEVGKYLPFLQM
ncbi:hypothetical protein JTE90_004637, partial [Oedothorax gibbosus]